MLGTGCRVGEALDAHWDDFDLDAGTWKVRRTIVRVRGRGLIARQPKTRAGLRTLWLPTWLTTLLVERHSATSSALVFPDARGGYRDRNNVEAALRRVREGTDLAWVIPHTFRKTVATRLDEAGLSARMVADQLGHSRVSMTQDTYFGRGTASRSSPRLSTTSRPTRRRSELMYPPDLDISVVDWWHLSIRVVERHGGRTVDAPGMPIPTSVPTVHLAEDLYETFSGIVGGLDAQLVLMTSAAKESPISPHDVFVDHLIYGKHGQLHVRVDAAEGLRLESAK